MWRDRSSNIVVILLAASVLIHGAVYAALDERAPEAEERRARSLVEMTVATPPPPPRTAPAPRPSPPPAEAEPPRIAARRAAPPPRPPAAPPPPPPPAAEAPADLSGVTLTNDDPGAGWSSQVGNGQEITAPIAAGGKPTGRRVDGAPDGVPDSRPKPPRLVPAADLREPPRAPDLDGALADNYPAEARRRGQAGRAVVRVRIGLDGRIGRLTVLSATDPSFGDACVRTLRGSRWTAPRDLEGNPAATEISYTCRFEVGS